MDSTINLCFRFLNLSSNGEIPVFSLDELLLETRDLFEKYGKKVYVETIVRAVDTMVCSRIIGKSKNAVPVFRQLNIEPCCADPYFVNVRRENKKLKTSLCKLDLQFTRIKCIPCGTSFVPMRSLLGIEKHQNKSNELVKVIIESVVDQSYRRSKKQLDELTGAELSLGQLWRSVMKNDFFDVGLSKNDLKNKNFQLNMDEAIREHLLTDPLHSILADGTCFKLQKAPLDVKAEMKKLKNEAKGKVESDSKFDTKARPLQSEVRIIYGITQKKEVIPLGSYSDKETWKNIGNDLYERFGKHKNLKPEPIAEVLIADGEEALFEGLGKLAKTEQRCQWHFNHEFKAVFRYQDDGNKKEQQEYQCEIQTQMDTLHEVVMTNTNKSEQKKLELEAEIIKAELAMERLAEKLHTSNYYHSETYVRNATSKLFTYLKHYLRLGILGPKVTSQLERFMREIGRRIKRIAWNWSAKGVATLCYIILVRCMNLALWEKYWKKILKVTGNIKMVFEHAVMKDQPKSLLQ